MITLRGITWDHPRGYAPLEACARRFSELNPGTEVQWARRSLLEFGETPVEQLAERFDLLVIDHPFIGFAARQGIFLPFDDYLEPETIQMWRQDSVGASGRSYHYADRMWAAPIDAACPVAVWREDLLVRFDITLPRTWNDVLELARRGHVLIPGVHTDAMHHFYMLLAALGAEPCADEAEIAAGDICVQALEELARLYSLVPTACRLMNPIAVHEALATGEGPGAYCPFAFGYSNYSRRSAARVALAGGVPPTWEKSRPLRTTLGGTGLAIARGCAHPAVAAKFAAFVAGADTQRSVYWDSGGQPANRGAWLDSRTNAASHNYLGNTLPALEAAWLRPRFPGYLHFQDNAAHRVHAAACGGLKITEAVEQINALWVRARQLRLRYEN